MSNIGWTQYGGGRNIKPGQKLETEEEKIARETKTKKLLDDYKRKLGLDMAPKDKARCERVSFFVVRARFLAFCLLSHGVLNIPVLRILEYVY